MIGRPVAVTQVRVDPDPSITSAIGRHHSLETAVADLVDNSIDASASHILVRVLVRGDRPSGLLVVDDGHGMDTHAVDHAMAYARRRDYDETALGHFGIGLKAASLSQADTLYVWSRRWGAPAVGRGLDRDSLDTGPLVQSFSTEDAVSRLTSIEPGFALETGTAVEWRDVRGFLQSPDVDEQRMWLESAIEALRTHLGVVLHRILARGNLTLTIDVLDEEMPEFGTLPRTVTPLDPFGYTSTGVHGYPRTLDLGVGAATAAAHIWPHAGADARWSLGGRSPLETQGLYVYRRDRLLQVGGWNELVAPNRDLVHARVALDIVDGLAPHVTINPEKTGVVFDAELAQAFHTARSPDGKSFRDYLDDTRAGAREARRRNPRPVQVAEPDRGYPVALIAALEENAEFFPGSDPVAVRWRTLMDDEVFRVDREERTLWLNSHYRAALGGRPGQRTDDAGVVKALLHLLLGEHLLGSYAGQREKRVEHAWNAILLAAVQDDTDGSPTGGRHRRSNSDEDEDA